MRLRIAVIALMIALPAAAQSRRHAIAAAPVPAEYRDLYSQLQTSLNAAEAEVQQHQQAATRAPIPAAELLPANGNRGTDLLQPGMITGVSLYLDRLQQLGVRGVVFALGYPLLLDRYPNSAAYLQFYKEVVAEARRRGMVVDIESSVLFANSPFSSVTWDYSKTTFAEFLQDRHAMVGKIVSELAPDYLDVGAEPDTEARLTGFVQLATPSGWASSISQILQGINRGTTKIGTGAGTWSSPSFIEAEAALPVDFIAMHVYPVDATSISNAFQQAAIARAHGKPIVLDEAWLYKARPNEDVSIAGDAKIFQRDSFSFFVPLDLRFLRFLDAFARSQGVTFVSPFWSTLFFAYLPYTTATAAQTYAETVQQLNAAAVANIVNGRFSTTGSYWGSLARQ